MIAPAKTGFVAPAGSPARTDTHANTAAVGRLQPAAAEAMARILAAMNRPDFYTRGYPVLNAAVQRVRARLATLLQTEESDLALMSSTSDGLAAFTAALPLQPGDVIVRSRGAFASVDLALYNRLKLGGVKEQLVGDPDGTVTPRDLVSASPDTRLIILDWTNYRSGARTDLQPIVEFAHRFNIPLLIDAAQGLGVLPIDFDMSKVAGFCCGGHKWLRGPEGTGVLHVPAAFLPRLTPCHRGYRSLDNPADFEAERLDLSISTTVFEVGTLNNLGFCGLEAAVAALHEAGPSLVSRRILGTATTLHEALADLPGVTMITPADPARRAGIVSFKHNRLTPTVIVNHLREAGVVVGVRSGCVRLSADADTPADAILDPLVRLLKAAPH